MKVRFLALALFITCQTLIAQAQWGESAKQIFKSPKLNSSVAKHKLVAILPFSVQLTYRKQPEFTLCNIKLSIE